MAILLPSWPILGATLRILAPALLDFFGNSSLHRAKVEKIIPRAPPDLHFFVFLEPPGDDFHHFPRCVFLVFVSVVHLQFMLQFFFHIRFAHTRLGFFRTRPDIKLCYAGCFAKRAQSGVARLSATAPCKITISNSKV